MRILLVTPFLPHSGAPHGGGIILDTMSRGLTARAEVGLVAIATPEEEVSLAGRMAPWSWMATAKAAVRPDRFRLPHKLRMLWRWRTMPLVAAKYASTAMTDVLGRAKSEFQPDVVFVEMAQMAQFLPLLTDLPTILTDHEAGCPANTRTGLGPLGDRRDQRLWWRYVRHFYPLANAIQALTSEDATVLSKTLDRAVSVRPSAMPVAEAPIHPDRAPARALFMGDYSHGPNPEAAKLLVHEVLPRLRAEIPEAELWLAGPNEDRVAELGREPGVRVLGFVPDLAGLLGQARLLLAPAFSGNGIRTKCITAHAHGLPVVTNELGSRGLNVESPALTVVEGPEALAQATLALLHSPQLAAEGGRIGYEWARSNVHIDSVTAQQIEFAEQLIR